MSVNTATRVRSLTDARIRSPSLSPGPRKDRPDVRLALSYDALNTNGRLRRPAVRASSVAIIVACSSLSITQGPPTKTSGRPSPTGMSPIVKDTQAIIGAAMPLILPRPRGRRRPSACGEARPPRSWQTADEDAAASSGTRDGTGPPDTTDGPAARQSR